MKWLLFSIVAAGGLYLGDAKAVAGDWLGREYYGNIAGCGHCGGTLLNWSRFSGCQGCAVDDHRPMMPEISTPQLHPSSVPVDAASHVVHVAADPHARAQTVSSASREVVRIRAPRVHWLRGLGDVSDDQSRSQIHPID